MKMIANRTSKSGYWQGNTWKPTTTATATGISTLANGGLTNSGQSYSGTWTTISPAQIGFPWVTSCQCGEEKTVAQCLACNDTLCFGCFILHYADRHAQEAIEAYEKTSPAL